jgi:hypothetical protein
MLGFTGETMLKVERIAMLEGVNDRLKAENQLIRARVQNAAVSVGLVGLGEGLTVQRQMELPAKMKYEILRLRKQVRELEEMHTLVAQRLADKISAENGD